MCLKWHPTEVLFTTFRPLINPFYSLFTGSFSEVLSMAVSFNFKPG